MLWYSNKSPCLNTTEVYCLLMLHVNQTHSISVTPGLTEGSRLTEGSPSCSCITQNTATESLWQRKKVSKEFLWTFHSLSLGRKQIADHMSLAKTSYIASSICKGTESLSWGWTEFRSGDIGGQYWRQSPWPHQSASRYYEKNSKKFYFITLALLSGFKKGMLSKHKLSVLVKSWLSYK